MTKQGTENAGIQINGSTVEAVEKVATAIMAILECQTADQVTKVEALKRLDKLCSIRNCQINNNTINVGEDAK